MNNKLIVEYNDKIAFHPGYYIKELIESEGITQEEFAKKMNITPKTISKLVNGLIDISDEMAINLSNMYKTSSEVWLNLQRNYDNLINEIKKIEGFKKQEKYLKYIDYDFFVGQNFVKKVKKPEEKIEELCGSLGVASLEVFSKNDYYVNYRNENTKILEKNILNSNIWVQTAIIKGKSQNLENKFNKEKLLNSITEIRNMVTKAPEEFYSRLIEIFKECGVSFVLLPPLKNSKINGAVKWIDKDNVILAINNRRCYADIFWFSLFHEIKHVLQEKTKKIILSNTEYIKDLDKSLEREADVFARDTLIPAEKYEEFVMRGNFTEKSILSFAEEVNTHSGIVVGRLQRENLIRFNQHNNLRTKYIIVKG